VIPARESLGAAVAGVGERHLLAYAKNERCELRRLFEAAAGKAKTVRRRLEKGGIAESFRQFLANGPTFELVRRDAPENFLDGSRTANNFPKSLPSIVSAKLFRDHYAVWRP